MQKSLEINAHKRQATSLTCIDLSRAFDCIEHSLLLRKLRKLQINSTFLKLVETYLIGRMQIVKLGNCMSDEEKIKFGAVQGGVMSGLFFNLYANSIKNLNLKSSVFFYCDDVSLVTSTNEHEQLKLLVETDLAQLAAWFKFHFLFPNPSKTKYILFHNKRSHENFIKYDCRKQVERLTD